MSQREWHDGVVDVADELVQERGVKGAIDYYQQRRQQGDADDQQRCNEAIAYIRREVADE